MQLATSPVGRLTQGGSNCSVFLKHHQTPLPRAASGLSLPVTSQTRRRLPESFKREAVDQVLAGTPLRHVAETLGFAESLLDKWKRQVTMPFRAMASSVAKARNCVATPATGSGHHVARCIKKGPRHLLAAHEVTFRAIEALAGRYPVAPMCRLLRVSRSGFYAWQQRPPSAREMANRRLSKEIRTIHHEVNGIHGHRRIKADLAAMGHPCARHRVARLMRETGLRVRSRKHWRLVSSNRHAPPIAPKSHGQNRSTLCNR
ncbi:IS3 family transposase [Pseudomonas aeruginosa]